MNPDGQIELPLRSPIFAMLSNTLFGLLAAFACSTAAVPVNEPAPLDNTIYPAFPYGSTKVRGVNLGGWLVLEVRLTFARRVLV
jgi:hypothetical protein